MSNDSRSRANFASGVSRTLVSNGLRPLPSGTSRSREGVRVTAGWRNCTANIGVDIDHATKAARIAADITEVLTAEGYAVEANPEDPTMLTVDRHAELDADGRCSRCGGYPGIEAKIKDEKAQTEAALRMLGIEPTPERVAQLLAWGAEGKL